MSFSLSTITIQSVLKFIIIVGFIITILFILGLIKNTNWNFQKFLVIFSIFILIICLIFIGVSINTKNNSWPPNIPTCPDYFLDVTIDPSGNSLLSGTNENVNGSKCYNEKNLGNCGKGPFDFTSSTYTGSAGSCAKYNWATGCGVSWDGITYGVDNPCNSNSS